MRIGMMADTYKPYVSGVTNYISLYKSYLERQGHQVFVFTFGAAGQDEGEAGVIHSPGLALVDTGFFINLRYSRAAKALLQTMDVIHVHHPFVSGRLALHYSRPVRVPVIFTTHTRYDLYIQAYLPFLPEGLGDTFLRGYLPPFCRAVDLVISPSQGMAEVLRGLGVDAPIRVIPNGVEFAAWDPARAGPRRADFGLEEDDVVLMYTGRLAGEKNLAFLLRAFNGVAQAYPRARLLLVGGGPEQANLESTTADLGLQRQVRFSGVLPYDQIPGVLRLADCFVTASVTEVHPLSIIEAMGAGLPVLGITSPGVADTIVDGQTGLLAPHDLASFTARMARLVSSPAERAAMAAAARAEAARYTMDAVGPLLLAEYQRLASTAARQRRGLRFHTRAWLERWKK
jgi:glycosyltransferase involved in cell wall biosynthesis